MSSYYEKILATGEVKCIDNEVLFEIPQGWEWRGLNDLAMYRKGLFRSSLTKPMFVTKSTRSIKVYEQRNAIQKNHTLGGYYISPKKFKTMQSLVVKPNDIIVSYAGTIGEIYLLPSDASTGIINQALMRVSLFDLNMAEYWQIYFTYMLLNKAQMKGIDSAIKNTPPSGYLKAVLVPIPPLSEQNRPVERYNIILSLIDKYELEANKLNRPNQNTYDKLKKSVLQGTIQGRLVPQIGSEGTAQELLEQIKEEKRKLVREGKLKKSALNDSVIFRGDDNKCYEQAGESAADISEQTPFDIPETRSWSRGRSIFLPMGSEKPKNDFVYIDVDAVSNEKYIIDSPKHITTESAPSRTSRKLYENDVLFSMVRPYLKNIAPATNEYKSAIASTGFCVITLCIGIYPQYLYWMMLSSYVVDGLNMFVKGDNSPSTSNCHIEEYLYPIPLESKQQRVVAQIETLFEQLH